MDDEEEMVAEQPIVSQKRNPAEHLKSYQWKKGESGNISGTKEKGETVKQYSSRRLSNMTPKQKEEFLEGMNKKDVWEMAEGKAKQDVLIEGEVQMLIKIDE
jgi:transposase